jgi:hypothetical protein
MNGGVGKMTKEKERNEQSKIYYLGKEVWQMKAVAYTCGMYVDNNGDIIDRNKQKAMIAEFAEKNEIEVVTVFEDLDESQAVTDRPGLKQMLSEDIDADIVLVDRVWALGRTRAAVTPMLEALDSKGMRLEACTDCFDVTSQFTRFWYRTPGGHAYTEAKKARNIERSIASSGR